MADLENSDASLPAPRASRFGEGEEGRGVRKERGLSGPRTSALGRMSQFLRDVRAEMKRVSWPTVNEVRNTTVITLIAVIFFAVYLFGVDQAWALLIGCDGSAGCGGHATGWHWLMSKLLG
jgi:preprotein translocase subunit SecE